jgi:hypothetical protein
MAKRERREGLSRLERMREDIQEENRAYVKKWERYFKQHNQDMPAAIRRLIRARLGVKQREAETKAEHDIETLTDYQRLVIRFHVAMETHPAFRDSEKEILKFLGQAKGNEHMIRTGLNHINAYVGYELRKPADAGDYWDE